MADDAEITRLLQGPLQLGSGRKSKPLTVQYGRDLTIEDLVIASQEQNEPAQNIKELRQSHHMLARVLAQGAKPFEAHLITGYSPSRISVLQADPAFIELLQFYKDAEAQQYAIARADMHERLKALGFDAIEVLHDRLRDTPDSFDPKTLLAISEATADRTGHGKTSTVTHDHSHALSDETIAALKASTNAGREIAQADRDSLLRMASERTAELLAESEEADWVEGGRGELREEGSESSEEPVLIGFVALPPVDRVQ